jgi:hypothetical protein
VPGDKPSTIPLAEPTVPTVGTELLHEPPGVPLVSVICEFWHTTPGPEIAVGGVFTVTTDVVIHPEGAVYVMVDVPELEPLTIPVDEPIVATVKLLLAHVPPKVALLRPDDEPTHTLNAPTIALGGLLTMSVIV